MTKTIRVLVAAPDALFRTALVSVLARQAEIEVVGSADNGASAVRVCERLLPDVAVFDAALLHPDGLQAARELQQLQPTTVALLLGMNHEEPGLLGVLDAGGSGYVLAPFADEHLAPAIRAAGRGEVFFYPRDARLILQGLGRIEASKLWESLGGERLDKRDVEVLQMTAAGLRSTDIAPVLDITPRAVERAQLRVVEKLGLKQRDMLVRYLQSHGSAEP